LIATVLGEHATVNVTFRLVTLSDAVPELPCDRIGVVCRSDCVGPCSDDCWCVGDEHLACAQCEGEVANVPVPLVVQLTVPVGVIGVPAAPVSATVAVHVVTLLTTMLAGAQTTVVLVVLD